MKQKIVVFGATGRLGAYLCLDLCKNYEVIAVGHRKSDNGFFADHNIPYYSVDISCKEDFQVLPVDDIYAVLHFAGALPGPMSYDATPYVSSIIQGTHNVLEYTRLVGADRIIFPQTLFDIRYLFGTKVPIPADALRKIPDGDHSLYVIAKNAAVDMIEHYYKVYGIKRFILRLPRIYLYTPNPYTIEEGVKFMISDRYLIEQAKQGADMEIWGDPKRLLETVDIRDCIQVISKSLTAEIDGGVYNVASGGSTLEERIKGIMEVFNPNPNAKITYCKEKPSAMQYTLDYLKTVNELGYQPKYKWIDFLHYFKEEQKINRFEKLWGKEEDFK